MRLLLLLIICCVIVFILINLTRPKITFLTFGGPTDNYHNAVKRICNEADKFGSFDYKLGYTEADLKTDDHRDFWTQHNEFMENNKRGYGYWVWKSYLIKRTLERMNDGDILLYCDAGCTLNPKGMARFNEYLHILKSTKSGVLAFQMNHIEKHWTKRALFDYFDCLNDTSITDTGQCVGGIIFIMKNSASVKLVNEWYATNSIYRLVNDDVEDEIDDFKENRHDQSILSILSKKNGAFIIPDETYIVDTESHFQNKYPIWATRLR